MNTYLALFRGINVGGSNMLPMKDLVGILEHMGCERIGTYIQSGNAVFQSAIAQRDRLVAEIATRVGTSHGFEPKVMLLDAGELRDAVEENPFETEDGRALHFFFLDDDPADPDLSRLMAVKSESERFELGRRVFYLHAPDGIGRSRLAARVENSLGVGATARNWNTVQRLHAMIDRITGPAAGSVE